ncbi:MAG TPA: hypothetical protein PKH97_12600 [Tetrasphaera sp.]|uniref:hypothetical protein n=1 Tax=Nostocoides sp. TaxID=1917966 RepID=UPI002C8E5F55|nr:hypothetical protein [Tetrasphaera sp.]HNQ08010.1 hypothetical protein [Tetrasphaera sp.]
MSSSGGGVVGVLVGLGFGDVGEGVGVIDVGDGLVVDGFGVAVGVGVVDVLAVAGSVVLGLGVLVVFGEVLDAPGVVTADVVAPARSPLGEHAVIPIVAASSTAAALTPRPLVISIPTRSIGSAGWPLLPNRRPSPARGCLAPGNEGITPIPLPL